MAVYIGWQLTTMCSKRSISKHKCFCAVNQTYLDIQQTPDLLSAVMRSQNMMASGIATKTFELVPFQLLVETQSMTWPHLVG